VAGVKENYASLSNLTLAAGSFLEETDDTAKARVCVLGQSAAKELFGSADEAEGSTIYIDDRAYTVSGVLATTGTVSGGISPDEAIFVPYETGIKYITGESISPTITVIADDVNNLDSVIADLETVLAENYSNTEFTFSDAGSKMEAAESSNRILTMLLTAMAGIVFLVGGIGIMNVLFVSVKERTNEIGILKSLGASRGTILMEFLIEAAAISLIGGVLGVAVSFAVTPIVELYSIRVETNLTACLAALGFAILTGTVFGFYPAWKASRLVPVEALNAE
jgi:putative ABC transport system permease protein